MSINQITDGVEAGNQDDEQGRLDSKQQTPLAAPDPVKEMRAQVAAETERINQIRLICANNHPEIESKAIREGWDKTRCELEVLREKRPTAPAIHVPEKTVSAKVLEAACLMTGQVDQIDAMFEDQTLNMASDRRS